MKTSTKNGPQRRVARMGALAAAAVMLGAILGTATAAQATTSAVNEASVTDTILGLGENPQTAAQSDVDPYWGNLNPQGFARVLGSDVTADPYWDPFVYDNSYGYLHVNVRSIWEDIVRAQGYGVLRWADEQHNGAAGGWLGARFSAVGNQVRTTPIRNLYWTRVTYGLGCETADEMVGWNQYLNDYACMPNRDWLIANRPGYEQQKADCVSGKTPTVLRDPWTGSKNVLEPLWNEDTRQWKNLCDSAYVTNDETYAQVGVFPDYDTGRILPGCAPWEKTGFSTENAPLCKYQFYAWSNNDAHPGEDGYFPPPGDNGGGGTDGYYAEVQRTVTTEETVTMTASVGKVTRTAVRGQVAKTVTKTINGKRYTATGYGDILTKGSASGYAEGTKTLRVSTTSTGACKRATKAEAEQCAADQAEALARQTNASKLEDAKAEYQRELKSQAVESAGRDAEAAARNATVTSADKTAAKKRAKADALAKIRKMSR